MKIYTFSEARQQLATLLKEARREGEVRIRRRDGQEFVIQPARGATGSPLDVPGIGLDIPLASIVDVVRESRRSTERFVRRAGSAPSPKCRPRKRKR